MQIHRLVARFALAAGALAAPLPVLSQDLPAPAEAAAPLPPSEAERLYDASGMNQTLDIMREEILALCDELEQTHLDGAPGPGWNTALETITDRDGLQQILQGAFAQELEGVDLTPVLAFYESPVGQQVVALETEARRGFLDPGAEDAASAAVAEGKALPVSQMALVDRYIATNDLVAYNLMGAMNSNYQFYQGLAEGGVLEMSDDEMLAEVWSRQDETAGESETWLRAFLATAYAPLAEEDLRQLIALSETDEGKRVNQAFFAGFNAVYDQVYHALGLAVASQAGAEEL